jgi:hypothetical protein
MVSFLYGHAKKALPRKVVEAETEAGSDVACLADILIFSSFRA